MGTSEGGRKAAATNKARHGDDFYRIRGARGGRNGTGHKFAHGAITPSAAGKLGGRPPKKSDAEVFAEQRRNLDHLLGRQQYS